MLCLLLTCLLIISVNQIDASHHEHDVQPLIEYIRQRRHQVYDVEPNDNEYYVEQKETYPKVTVTQHKKKGNKHKKQKNVKHEKVKNENIKNNNRNRTSISNAVPENTRKNRKNKKDRNKWVQESYKESNVSESDEKHSPVDIVVHIKMNE